MDYIKNALQKKGVVSIICAIVCILIVFFAYRWRINQVIKAVEVPIAVRELQPREEIKAEDFKLIKVASALLSNDVYRGTKTDLESLKGKYVNYNTIIPKGSLFYESSVTEWKNMPDSAWSNIEEGNTVVSLPVSKYTIFSNSIFPGAVIDLYYKTYDEKLVYGKLIENIKVIAVKDESGKHIFDRTASQNGASAIIFSVGEDLNLLLRKASYLSGEIVPVLRNTKYSTSDEKRTLVKSDYIKAIIEEQTIDIPADVIDNLDEEIQIEGEEKIVTPSE